MRLRHVNRGRIRVGRNAIIRFRQVGCAGIWVGALEVAVLEASFSLVVDEDPEVGADITIVGSGCKV
jgi:hypothetical protein